jgi:thiamine kinase-like enzyme
MHVVFLSNIIVVKQFSFDNEDERSKEQLEQINIPLLEKEAQLLEQLAIDYTCESVFCHNDLLPYNIILNEETSLVSFIDYEYCGYNYRGFDIGNHWIEYSGFSIDPSFYPSVDAQKQFIQHYVSNSGLNETTEDLHEKLRVEANFFSLWANLAWGVWSVPQFKNSTIDFDFLEYGLKKLSWYWKVRDQYIEELKQFHEKK